MIWRIFLATVYIHMIPVATNAEDINLQHVKPTNLHNAKKIHQQHCVTCHKPDIYRNIDSTIKTIPQLRARVLSCSVNSDAVWFDEEVDAVTAYLNINYYFFHIK